MLSKLNFNPVIMATWWKPWTWGSAIQDATEAFQGLVHGWLLSGTEGSLDAMMNMFNTSVVALRQEVALTPSTFNYDLVQTLKGISTSVVFPIAAMLITYVFVLEIIEETTKANKGQHLDTFNIFMLIIRTTITIALATHAFTIGLAFSDVSTWMIRQVDTEDVSMNVNLKEELLGSVAPIVEVYSDETGTWEPNENLTEPDENDDKQRWDYRLGELGVLMIVSMLGFIFSMVIGGIMYLTAWSRIIMILLYVTVAPIPMATLMSESWVGTIGQNYLRNLLALTLQGFFMTILLVIYQGLLERSAYLLSEQTGGYTGLVLVLVSMFTIAKLLIGSQGFAKSITGAT